MQTPLWCIDAMCSYLAQQLRMTCRLKRRFQIADMTLCQRSRTNIIKTCKVGRNTNIFIYFDRGCSNSPQCLHIMFLLQQTSRNIFMTLKLRFKFKYFLKSVLRLLTQTPQSCINGVPSYLAQ